MSQKKDYLKKFVEAALELSIVVILLLLLPALWKTNSQNDLRKINTLEGWYELADGERKEVSLPLQREYTEGEVYTIFNDSLSEQMAGMTIVTMAAEYNLIIALENVDLYRYSDELFPRNNQMKGKVSCNAIIPSDAEGKVLSCSYTMPKNGTSTIPEIYIGRGEEVLKYYYQESLFTLVITFIMLLAGVLSFAAGIYMKRFRMWDARFVDVALFLIECAIWCITDSFMVNVFPEQSAIISMVSFYAFMMFAIPMLHFIKNTGEMRQYWLLDLFICLFYLNAIIQGILLYQKIFSMIQMLLVTQILLFSGVFCCVLLLIREYLRTKSKEIRVLLHAFSFLGSSGVLALLLYWIFEISFYEVIFECGIVIFGVVIFNEVILTVVHNFHYRTEMQVYERLAKEDQMTGMGNRRAFDEYINEFQMDVSFCDNAVLIFLDLNRLKYTNDHHGHSAGDEMIVAVARCIKNVFGETGKCFRLGGDEFCVILKDPQKTIHDFEERLEKEIQMYNRMSRYPISVAKGISYLKKEDGTRKRISDWKYEADLKMYEDKGRQRRV